VRELVENHARIERRVPAGRAHQAHVHHGAEPILARGHIRGAENRAGMRARVHAVALEAAPREIASLEIAVTLPESEQVEEVSTWPLYFLI
jgi:hypothetical protein